MLSQLERERLENRESLDQKIRATNDARVKKKLLKWLDDGIDAFTILSHLPLDKLKDELSDYDVYRLFNITKYVAWSRKFMAISAEKDEKNPEWYAEGYGIIRPADSTDIARAICIDEILGDLRQFIGPKNPVPGALFLERIWDRRDDPEVKRLIRTDFTSEEEDEITRVKKAREEYTKAALESLEIEKKPPKEPPK